MSGCPKCEHDGKCQNTKCAWYFMQLREAAYRAWREDQAERAARTKSTTRGNRK